MADYEVHEYRDKKTGNTYMLTAEDAKNGDFERVKAATPPPNKARTPKNK